MNQNSQKRLQEVQKKHLQLLKSIIISTSFNGVSIKVTAEPKIISIKIDDRLSETLENDIQKSINIALQKGAEALIKKAIIDLDQS